jgi:ABC-2 type transport system permease protein
MHELEAVYTVWLREMIRYFRAKERILSSLAMPIFWLLVFGSSIRAPVFGGEIDYTSFIAPGVIVMTIMFTSMHSGISVIWDRELGFMKEMLVAPVSRISIVIGKSLGGATTALIQGTIILLLIFGIQNLSGEYFSGVRIDISSFLIGLPLMVLIGLGLVGIGVAIASLLDTLEGFGMIMNFVIMPMFFLSGALFPINNLPEWFRVITYIDPVTYGVESLRFVMTGFSSINVILSFTVVLAFTCSMLLVATHLFNKRS